MFQIEKMPPVGKKRKKWSDNASKARAVAQETRPERDLRRRTSKQNNEIQEIQNSIKSSRKGKGRKLSKDAKCIALCQVLELMKDKGNQAGLSKNKAIDTVGEIMGVSRRVLREAYKHTVEKKNETANSRFTCNI